MARERHDTPRWALAAGEKIHSFEDRLPLSGLVNLIAGSSSELYQQITWHRVNEVCDYATQTPTELPLAKADPNARALSAVIPRLKQSAVIMEAGQRLPEVRNSLAKEYGPARVSVAYTYKDRTHVGDIPGEITTLQTSRPNLYRAAMRSGRSDFGAAIGVWVMDEEIFVPAPDSVIAENNVPISSLSRVIYPNIRLF